MKPRRTLALLAGLFVAATLAMTPAPALAQADEGAAAFEQGRAHWAKKDHAAALPYFERAVALTGSPNARIFLARCLRELGRLPEAYTEMERTMRDARARAETDPRYAETRDAAAADLAVLEGKVGRLSVALSPGLAGAQVWLDQKPLATDLIGKPVAVAPGSVRITAKTADGVTVEQRIDVPAGTLQTTTLAQGATSSGPGPTPEPTPPETDGGDFGVVRGVGVGMLGLGALGFVGFAVGTVQADDAFATLEATCGAGPCTDSSSADVISEGKTFEAIAVAGLVIGIAGVAAGTIMLIVGEPSSEVVAIDQHGVGLRF